MANSAETNNDSNNKKVFVGTSLDPTIFGIVTKFAVDQDRSVSNMVERLLKTHPEVQPLLEGETAGATA
jgi:hypothetical protein